MPSPPRRATRDTIALQVMMGVITNLLPRPELPPECVERYPARLCELMRQCWQQDASARPHFDAILDTIESVAREEDVRLTGPASPLYKQRTPR